MFFDLYPIFLNYKVYPADFKAIIFLFFQFSLLPNLRLEITIKIDRYSKATSIGDPMTPTTL